MAKVIGLVPARAGSKGLPGKNQCLLNGKPLITYTLDAALGSEIFSDIVVSSDDEQILALAREMSLVDHRRSPELAQDETPMGPVIADIIQKRQLIADDVIMLLQPTSPMRTAKHIYDAYQRFNENNCDVLVSVCPIENKLLKAYTLTDHFLEPIGGLNTAYTRRQDLPKLFMPNGAIYIFSVESFEYQHCIPRSKVLPFIMTEQESMDVDDEADLALCSKVLQGLPGRRTNV